MNAIISIIFHAFDKPKAILTMPSAIILFRVAFSKEMTKEMIEIIKIVISLIN